MKKKISILFCSLMLFTFTAFASNIDVDFKIARGESDSNVYLLGIKRNYSPWLQRGNFSIVPSLGITGFVFDPKHDSSVWGATFAGGLTFNFSGEKSKTYLFLSSGPTYISDNYIGRRDMGGQFHFASTVAIGFRFGPKQHHALEAFLTHYSHAGIDGKKNPGYNVYGLGYKYSF